MIDNFSRKIDYLRLSVTDLCNFRCIYCMSEDGIVKREHSDILSIEELIEIARASYKLDIKKLRLTGGEPLVRRGICGLVRGIRNIAPDIELSMTTNGSLLADYAEELKAAGLDRLNISLDTLDPDRFTRITRRGNLSDVLRGLEAAKQAGFDNIKINTVLLGGINDADLLDLVLYTRDNDVSVRFIELMPMGEVRDWPQERFVSCSVIESMLKDAEIVKYDGVARVYRIPSHKGTIGLISPISRSFCDKCNKIRVTADGKLKPCLHSSVERDLRGLSGEELVQAMREGILQKPMCHNLIDNKSESARPMNEIGG